MKLFTLFALLLLISIQPIQAQETTPASKEDVENVKGQVDGMNETMLEMKSVLDALKKIKISGYIQSQFQVADSDGIASVAGGNFPTGVHSRFAVRRGRVK
ncbi:MAG TPA: hypothetical protein VK470_03360, partial [Bacteroidota bacterium]|nr:hypothetical protein [Bacteroidota bacterium]